MNDGYVFLNVVVADLGEYTKSGAEEGREG